MIQKIDAVNDKYTIGVSALVDKINEIIDSINIDLVAKDTTIAKLSAELTAVRKDAGLAAKEPVVAIPIKEEPIEPVIEEPIGG